MYEYLVTAFKVIVGVITNDRLAIAGLVALGLMLIWVILSLVFSFQIRFARHAKQINEYVGKNGLGEETKEGLNKLVGAMPSEFQREFSLYEESQNALPSKYIKRFESLDVELSGGVFNQNKSILKTYTNFVTVLLLVFSIAVLGTETALTGYLLAEATVIPLCFLLIAKVMYYVYTAIRQYQYRVAVDEFNEMLDNLDMAHKVAHHTDEAPKQDEVVSVNVNVEDIYDKLKVYLDEYMAKLIENVKTEPKALPENAYEPSEEVGRVEQKEVTAEPVNLEPNVEVEKVKANETKAEEVFEDVPREEEQASAKVDDVSDLEESEEANAEDFKLDFKTLVDSSAPVSAPKRGRGRPKKETSGTGEFVIKDDKEFEDALVRAEKLMRKNEQPLSASQTKRIEKQIKELVDAMTKYKESKQ